MEPLRTIQGTHRSYDERLTMEAWENLLSGKEISPAPLCDLIVHSWDRCRSSNVNPSLSHTPELVTADDFVRLGQQHRELIEASAPFTESVRNLLSETNSILILSDPTGHILKAHGDPATLEAALEVGLIPGGVWQEQSIGTNAIGTALAAGEPVQVHGAEHFCAGIKRWSCSATVVRDPFNGEILGGVDISGLAKAFNPYWLGLAMTLARSIEERLARRNVERRCRLIEAGLRRFSNTPPEGLIFFDRKGNLVRSDAHAARALAAMEVDLKISSRVNAFNEEFPETARMKLPEWIRPEWLEPIIDGGEKVGTALVLPAPSGRGSQLRYSSGVILSKPEQAPRGCFEQILWASPSLGRVVEKARELAEADLPALLLGETGAGKEVFAEAIHKSGRRGQGPFIPLNCGGMPREILASELFGYVEGAFSGARRSGMVGRIEAANKGTLFLDEIGEIPLDMQPYLLRVLEEGKVYPLGDNKPRRVDFRLIAATNKDLRTETTAGRFRLDLFYRVSVGLLRIPPLRERKGDIPFLVERFNSQVAERHDRSMKEFEPDVMAAFAEYSWPGNVRELRNLVESLVVLMGRRNTVTMADLPQEFLSSIGAGQPTTTDSVLTKLEGAERDAVKTTIYACRGNLTQAAEKLGIAKSTLYQKIKEYGLAQEVANARARTAETARLS
jgi:sigma-54 dependent transcriptional regulator, acetoin dehydrogenase operon transcriptional activator AcoR